MSQLVRGYGTPSPLLMNCEKCHIKNPLYFGQLTNNIVYSRLAPEILEQLKKETPRDDKGRHKHQLHRKLTADIGHPKLREHLASSITPMRVSDTYGQFERLLDRALPKYNETMVLPFKAEDQAREFNFGFESLLCNISSH